MGVTFSLVQKNTFIFLAMATDFSVFLNCTGLPFMNKAVDDFYYNRFNSITKFLIVIGSLQAYLSHLCVQLL